MRKRNEIWILICILLLGACLRLLYWREIQAGPGAALPQVDASYHDYFARALITGNWTPPPSEPDPHIQSTPYFRAPGYPLFLSLVYRLTGSSYGGARLFQMSLGLCGVFLAYLWGRRLRGGRMGLIFAGLMASYWGFIYFEGDFLEPVLVTTLSLLLLWDLGGWTPQLTVRRALRAGLLLGLLALVRPNLLLFAPVVLLWASGILRDRRKWLGVTLGFLLAMVLTIAPATLRNAIVAQDFVPITSNSGINLLIGNNPQADGTLSPALPGLGDLGTSFEYPRLVAAVEAKVGRPLKHSEVSAYFRTRAFDHILAQPLFTAKLLFQKTLLFWGPLEVGNNKEDEIERANSPLLRRLPLRFAGVAALFFFGMLIFVGRWKHATLPQRNETLLLAGFTLAFFLSYLPYFVAGRFRTPLVPCLLFFGALGIDWLVEKAQDRHWKVLALGILGLLLFYGITSRNFSGYVPTWEKWHYDQGVLLAKTGKTEEAIRQYQTALQYRSDDAPTHFNLGSLYQAKGERDLALAHFHAALKFDPKHAPTHQALAKHTAQRGDFDQALRHYQTALALAPAPQLLVDYAGILVQQKKDAEAEVALRKALHLNPAYVPAHNNLAVLLYLKGDYRGAWQAVKQCQQYGGIPPAGFVQELARRMPDPKAVPEVK